MAKIYGLIEIQNTLISTEVLSEQFHCDLNACKGACCVEGEAGAPLEESETEILVALFQKIKPYLRQEGVKAIEEQGSFVKGEDGEWETPLINKKECAYAVFTETGIAQCGIERAHSDGAIDWIKPISCHLYPVRIKEYKMLTAVNYHQWHICDPACSLGKQLKLPVYKFVKEALIRKFGQTWYDELEAAGQSAR